MSEAPFEPPPELPSARHEVHVQHVRDVTKDRKIVFRASPDADMGWRQSVPVTYDIVLDPPQDQVDTSQGK